LLLYRLDVIYRYIDVAKEVHVATSSIRNDPPDPRDKDLRDNDPHDKLAARIAIVEQHVRLENAHDLEGVLGTFGDTARYDDESWGEHFNGRDGVRQFYEQLMKALPDLQIEIQRRHVADDAIILEVMIRGTQLGAWRGLPATGRQVEFPLCGIYTFDADNRLAGEKIYYDRGTVLHQLGVFHEPPSVLGQIGILLTHPITIARALARNILRK
jgi:steroid delta-isomerase-like uncharacterized protein